jgi:hypothetical protein
MRVGREQEQKPNRKWIIRREKSMVESGVEVAAKRRDLGGGGARTSAKKKRRRVRQLVGASH